MHPILMPRKLLHFENTQYIHPDTHNNNKGESQHCAERFLAIIFITIIILIQFLSLLHSSQTAQTGKETLGTTCQSSGE